MLDSIQLPPYTFKQLLLIVNSIKNHYTDQFTFLNNIAQNDAKDLKIIIDNINLNAIKEHYIVMNLKYTDPIFEKIHEQIYYLKWYGIEDGKPQQIFHASKEDKDRIVNYLKKL